MISGNNKLGRLEQTAKREQHFGIRKLSVGAASVLLGTTLWLGANTNAVKADTVNDGEGAQAAEQAKAEVSTKAADAQKVVVVANDETQSQEKTDDSATGQESEKLEQNTASTDQTKENETKQTTSQKVDQDKDVAADDQASTQESTNKQTSVKKAETVSQAKEETPADNTQTVTDNAKSALANKVQVENGKVNTAIAQTQTIPDQENTLNNIQKSAQAGKTENNETQDLDLSKVATAGVKTDSDNNLEKELANVGIAKTKKSIEDTKQANQIDDKNAKRIAQKYGISLAAAQNSVAASSEVQNQLKDFTIPSMSQEQLQQVIGKIGAVISDPNVQSMAKDLIRGNWAGVMKDGASVGQQLINNLGGIQGIIQDVTGKIAGSDWQQTLKKFNIPTMTQAQMQQVIGKIGATISDPNVQGAVKDLITGNYNDLLKKGEAVGQQVINNLGGIQGIIQDVTGKIAGSDWQQTLKKFNIPTMTQAQMQQVISKIGATISDPNVQGAVKDLITGNYNDLLKKGEAVGQQVVNNLGGIQGIIQDVTGKIAGSDWQKTLKKFNIPTMTQAQMQKVISKLGMIISNPNVQNAAKDLITGNLNGLLKSGEAIGQQLINNLGGIQGIIQSVTGKIAGSDWQKTLKKFNIPTMTQAQLQQVVSQLGQVISDPNVQSMAKDMIFGNWNGVLKNGAALGQKLVNSLGGIQGIIQKVTTDIAQAHQHKGTSLLDKLKNIVPAFATSQKQAAQKLINNIKSPQVKTIVSDVVNGKFGKLLLDTIHYGVSAIKQAYTKAKAIIKQVKENVQKQVATIKTSIANIGKKSQTSTTKSTWGFKLPKLQLPKLHFNLFGKRLAF